MKKILSALLLLPFLALSQNEKGVSPIKEQQTTNNKQQTYAVVVGISDYQDEGISDLRFGILLLAPQRLHRIPHRRP